MARWNRPQTICFWELSVKSIPAVIGVNYVLMRATHQSQAHHISRDFFAEFVNNNYCSNLCAAPNATVLIVTALVIAKRMWQSTHVAVDRGEKRVFDSSCATCGYERFDLCLTMSIATSSGFGFTLSSARSSHPPRVVNVAVALCVMAFPSLLGRFFATEHGGAADFAFFTNVNAVVGCERTIASLSCERFLFGFCASRAL